MSLRAEAFRAAPVFFPAAPAHPAWNKGSRNCGRKTMFPTRDEALGKIPWEHFFEKFDHEHLAFLYQDKTTDPPMSRFHKFVNR